MLRVLLRKEIALGQLISYVGGLKISLVLKLSANDSLMRVVPQLDVLLPLLLPLKGRLRLDLNLYSPPRAI
jgi:hypothetical protein